MSSTPGCRPSITTTPTNPDEAHAIVRQARKQAPIAIGPHGPELLTYELVHAVLRDPRFRIPQGMFLAAQGITSGPLWDRIAANLISLDGDEHHRLRRLVSRAFTPRSTERLRTTITDVITELVDRHADQGRCDVVTDIARPVPDPHHLRASRRSAARTGSCSPTGPTTSSRPSAGMSPTTIPAILARLGRDWTPTSTTWSPDAVTR